MTHVPARDRASRPPVLLTLGLAGLAGCNVGDSSPPATTGGQVGQIAQKPGGGAFVVAPNQAGQGQAVRLTGLFWGRMVDVYETVQATGERRLVFSEFVVGDDIATDGVDFVLERDPLTEVEELVLLHELGTPGWDAAFARLEANLQPIQPKGLSVGVAPPFSAMPRNAVLVVAFDDLLASSSVDATTVQLRVGTPPTQVLEARVFPDPNHGDVADHDGFPGPEFHPTRVLVDPQVTELEATSVSLPINGLGLPASSTPNQANVAVRIPTVASPVLGQTDVLANPTGHRVAFVGNGPVDASSPTQDVVRAFRSGGPDDPFNGFLRDLVPPRLIGTQDALVQNVQPVAGTTDEFTLDLSFAGAACAVSAEPGDVLRGAGLFAEVVAPRALTPPTSLSGLHVRVLGGTLAAGPLDYLTVFDPNASLPACFVRFGPAPSAPPAAGVSVDATVDLRFSEPMDPASIGAFDTFRIERGVAASNPMESRVVGSVVASGDARTFRFEPATDFEHVQGQAETYSIVLSNAITDLAGNSPVALPPAPSFQIDASEPTRDTGGLVVTFDSTDEDDVAGPEWRGNMVFDASQGSVEPRPVTRFSAAVDTQVPQIALMAPGAAPVPQPLVKQGSRSISCWRHVDMSLGLLDESTFDIDVEGLNWAPFGGALSFDEFESFRMALAHSMFLPDEVLTPMGTAQYPASGLVANFDGNLLDASLDPYTVVHSDSRPYTIQPLDTFLTSTGLTVTPYPMNRGIPADQFTYYTYRDTSIPTLGAPSGNGADPDAFFAAQGMTPMPTYAAGAVPTIGLPLLMEFRCRPDTTATGLNGFNTVLPTPIPTAIGPAFQVHASGGIDGQGNTQVVEPDNASTATTSSKTFYLGQADFVVRVSRVHSRWFDTGSLGGATFEPAIVDVLDQPVGTHVALAYRGASSVLPSDTTGGGNAANIGAYGDPGPTAQNPGVAIQAQLVDPTGAFASSIAAIDGARFFQVRMTFVSNPETGLVPRVRALGFAYER